MYLEKNEFDLAKEFCKVYTTFLIELTSSVHFSIHLASAHWKFCYLSLQDNLMHLDKVLTKQADYLFNNGK